MLKSIREENFLKKFKFVPIAAIIPVKNSINIAKAIIYVLNMSFLSISALPQISR